MDQRLEKELEELRTILHAGLTEGISYLDQLNDLPTSVPEAESQTNGIVALGKGSLEALSEFKERFSRLMVASSGPRYWGFVTGGSTPAALLGDMLASIYDQNTQTTKGHGDLSGLIELETIRLLLDLFGLPEDFLGGFVTGATMSNFTCLGVARQWLGKQLGIDIAKTGTNDIYNILAAVPHSSSIKALSMLGLGSSNIRLVKTINATREAIDPEALEKEIRSLGGQPFILITSGGTVNTVDFDDFTEVARLKEKYNFWWHIDAAFGGFASLSPDYQHLLSGWEGADSITMDGHKWLNVPYESAFFFVKEKHKYLQVETFQNSNAPYLGDPLENFNYLNFLPENSRRFKALPAWFTIKAYGKEGYREIIERNIHLAQRLGALISTSKLFELLAPVRLNTVCFTLQNSQDPDAVRTFLNVLNDSGEVFMTPTVFNHRNGIRAALVNWRTTEADVEIAWKAILKAVEQIRTTP